MNKITKPPFILILRNEKIPYYHKLAFVFAGIQIAAFVFLLFFDKSFYAGLTGLCLTVLYFLLRRYLIKTGRQKNWMDETIFLLFSAVWIWTSLVMAILMFITALLFRFSIQEWKYVFTEDGVHKNFFPRKHYEWSDFFNIVLKDGILTLDYSDNHLQQIIAESGAEIDEEEFNIYVHKQLAMAKNVPE